MKKKSARGGYRDGAGRKPTEDPKVPITIYVPGSWIKKIKKPAARDLCVSALEKEANKL